MEKIVPEYLPEGNRKKEFLEIEIDDELIGLLEEAKKLVSEGNDALLLKIVLKAFIREKKPREAQVKKHTRYVPASLAREVMLRAGYRCEYLSPQGMRCNQKYHLQVDHIRPFGKGGSSHDIANLRILCRLHNLHCASRDFPEKSDATVSTAA